MFVSTFPGPAAGEATRKRILVATLKELVTYRPGGARINRIATSARASTERLYAYFPGKEALFAAAINNVMSDVTPELDMTGDDLPGYAGRLFDLRVPRGLRAARSMAHPGPAMTQLGRENGQPDSPDARRRTVVELVGHLTTPANARK